MRFQALLLAALIVGKVSAGEPIFSTDDVRNAISRAIPLLEKGAGGSADKRKCFTCHSNAMPVLALVEARWHGFKIDEEKLERQLVHTADHLKRGHKNYLEGKGQGGRVITAGYALWALESGGRESDEVTTAVAGYLLTYQRDKDRWSQPGRRPPSSGSDFTTTYVALRGLDAFGTDEQQPLIEERQNVVGKWLLGESPTDTESRVFRLRAMKYVDGSQDDIDTAIAELTKSQRDDGGWSQTPDLKSDAYATATVLVALLREDDFTLETPVIRRGIAYLVHTQLEDGTWHVVSNRSDSARVVSHRVVRGDSKS